MAVERTRTHDTGFPYLQGRLGVLTIRRVAATTLAVVALAAAITSSAAALAGYADAGVQLSSGDATVASVSPIGFAWREGIRPGQAVVRLDDSSDAGGWRLVTASDGQTLSASAATFDMALRASLPIALGAMVFGTLAVLMLRGRRRWSTPAACVALLLATPSLYLYGKPETSTIAMALSAMVPALWLAWRPRLPVLLSVAGTLAAGALIGLWAISRLTADPGYDGLEAIRDDVALAATTLVVLVAVVVPLVRSDPIGVARPKLSDLVAVAGVGALSLLLVTMFSVSVVVPGAAILSTLLVLPAWRSVVGGRTERLLLTDVREHAALEAAEAERAHLARELHDAPLQELAAVIRRLELIPAARTEADELRSVAQHLRTMATELRPPVLDDLGVAAAIEFVAELAAMDGTPVRVAIDNVAGIDLATRPPAPVELATFRIVQEAITNAVRHAGATTIRVVGGVSPVRIELTIEDDGRGIPDDAAIASVRRGHLGLASMRRRAEAVDADLTIEGSSSGTRIRFRWQA